MCKTANVDTTSAITATWTLEDFVDRSASRFDGITEKEERLRRLAACSSARSAIRLLIGSKSEMSLKSQVMACHLVQRFLLMNSLIKEEPVIVGLGAALLALQAIGLACSPQRIIEVCEPSLEAALWAKRYPEECLPLRPLRDPSQAVEDVALRMSCMLREECGLASASLFFSTALDFVEQHVSNVEQGFVASKAFAARPVSLPLQQLTQMSRCLIADAVQGPCAAFLPPSSVSAACVSLAARILLRREGFQATSEEVQSFVEGQAFGRPNRAELKLATDEVVRIYKIKEERCWSAF